MSVAKKLQEKNEVQSELSDIESEIKNTVSEIVEQNGYRAIDVNTKSAYLEFSVIINTSMLDRDQIQDMDEWFEELVCVAVQGVTVQDEIRQKVFFSREGD